MSIGIYTIETNIVDTRKNFKHQTTTVEQPEVTIGESCKGLLLSILVERFVWVGNKDNVGYCVGNKDNVGYPLGLVVAFHVGLNVGTVVVFVGLSVGSAVVFGAGVSVKLLRVDCMVGNNEIGLLVDARGDEDGKDDGEVMGDIVIGDVVGATVKGATGRGVGDSIGGNASDDTSSMVMTDIIAFSTDATICISYLPSSSAG